MIVDKLITLICSVAFLLHLTTGFGQQRAVSDKPTPITKKAAGALDQFLRNEMSQRRIPGMQVAVVQGGKVVLLKSYGIADLQDSVLVTNQSVFSINSCTKAFTGVAIMQLVEEGKVDLSAPVSRYLDGLPATWQPVTIRQLLTHVSGLPDVLRALNPQGQDISEETAWAKTQAMPMDFPTGEQFSYNQTNYALLGKIIDKFSGKPFAQVFSQRQFQVVGMPNTGFGDSRDVILHKAPSYRYITRLDGQTLSEPKLSPSYEEFPAFRRTASGMNSTAEDLARWIIALQQGKLFRTKTALDTMWTAGKYKDGSPTQWALGWGFTKFRASHKAVGMTGGGRSAFLVYPDDDLALVVLTNLAGSFPEDFIEELAGYYNPAIPLADPITNLRLQLRKRGFEQAVAVVSEMKRQNPALQPTESELNDWAYRIMRNGQPKEALELFKLNVSLYPKSWNTYDSLAEAYEQLDHKVLAIENYKLSLTMNPGNTNAVGHLKKLEKTATK